MIQRPFSRPCRSLLRALTTTACLALASVAQSAPAQERAQTQASGAPAVLLADSLVLGAGNVLVAAGNVEVLYDGARLTASRVTYDSTAGSLAIDGPIRLEQGERVVILASSAQLSDDLRNGILTSARLVLDRQLQLAAAEINRVDGRYTQLYKTVASACEVCAARPVPLWQIRAKEVVHDSVEQQLYFTKATFEIAGVPVLYLPRMRFPDPELSRATGFLVPNIRTSTQLGVGIEVPYFITLGDSADVTVSPFVSPNARSLGVQYRQAFARGDLEIAGAGTFDDLTDDRTRGYLFASGTWQTAGGLTYGFDLKTTSDIAYLLDYDISSADRLESAIFAEKFDTQGRALARLYHFQTLRESDIDIADTLPAYYATALYERRFSAPGLGGQGYWQVSGGQVLRESTLDESGRDVLRLGAKGGWSRDWLMPSGLLLGFDSTAALDQYWTHDDSTQTSPAIRLSGASSLTLTYPMLRATSRGTDVITPIAQLGWSGFRGDRVPQEDSTLVELDEANLMALSRYPGHDASETGPRAALGFSYAHAGTGKIPDYSLKLGRIFTLDTGDTLATGDRSNWVIALQASLGAKTHMSTRAQLDGALEPAKLETRLTYAGPQFEADIVHAYVRADPDENRDKSLNELTFATDYQWSSRWSSGLAVRYDLDGGQASKLGVELGYRNECVAVALGVTRRFTNADTLEASTGMSFSVALAGFGGTQASAARSQCLR
ncbi:LPS-assembly protein LptD precursor [Aquimixticola soesokkakensis]|uniref:LPS-assembly protein LptD n=1 Tax=Aquimixticola soesokkakensis TaxID=1519096 RepID=A0A1Y5TLI9_9RHOB|nr:LPS assembly protein LptD [Aquimixticola soesokkakensis]SLN64938.1 LPS-assembly protein LptD precursor [Aquimixticola soesokkakensis]